MIYLQHFAKHMKVKLTLKDKVDECLKYVDIIGKIPPVKSKFSNGSCMGGFWRDCKYRHKCNTEPYIKLLSNDLFNNSWEEYLNKRI